jgi:hypothetical protein
MTFESEQTMHTTPPTLSLQPRCLRRRLRDHLMLLCVVIALSSCTTAQGEDQPTPNSVPPTPPGTILAFTTIAQGDQISGTLFVTRPQIIIIANASDVDVALRQATGDPPRLTMSPHPVEQARQIDYTRSFAILALQGGQGTSGYSVTVDQVIRQEDRVQVQASFVWPGQDGSPAATSAVLTDPYHLIAILKTGAWGAGIRFELVDKGNVVAQTTHTIPNP